MARTEITNEEQLRQAILKDMKDAIDRTTIRLLEELQRNIEEIVYDAGTPQEYERTRQFFEMWKAKPSIITGSVVTGEVSPDYETLITNKNKHQHTITGEALVSLIIQGYGNQEMWFNQPRDFWDKFEDYVDANAERIFMEEMNRSNGFTLNIRI